MNICVHTWPHALSTLVIVLHWQAPRSAPPPHIVALFLAWFTVALPRLLPTCFPQSRREQGGRRRRKKSDPEVHQNEYCQVKAVPEEVGPVDELETLAHRISATAMAILQSQWRYHYVVTPGKFLLSVYRRPVRRKDKLLQMPKGDVRDVKTFWWQCWKTGRTYHSNDPTKQEKFHLRCTKSLMCIAAITLQRCGALSLRYARRALQSCSHASTCESSIDPHSACEAFCTKLSSPQGIAFNWFVRSAMHTSSLILVCSPLMLHFSSSPSCYHIWGFRPSHPILHLQLLLFLIFRKMQNSKCEPMPGP